MTLPTSQEISNTGSLRVFQLRRPDAPSLVPSSFRTTLGLPLALLSRLNFINRLPTASNENGNESNHFPAAIVATGNTLGRPFNVHGRNTEKSPGGRHSGPFSRHVCLVSSNSPTESVSTKVFGSIVIKDRCKRRSDSVETIAREIPDSKCSFFRERP